MLYLFAFVSLPTTSDFIAGIGSWSSAMFNELYEPALVMVGFSVGVLIIVFLVKGIPSAFRAMFKRKDEEI